MNDQLIKDLAQKHLENCRNSYSRTIELLALEIKNAEEMVEACAVVGLTAGVTMLASISAPIAVLDGDKPEKALSPMVIGVLLGLWASESLRAEIGLPGLITIAERIVEERLSEFPLRVSNEQPA